ncbi:MAG TPA: hypothetical protein VFW11_09815 [Cyclobacteriaceae bacterium]|nr:hypothetical protein [Cyclobacteriaceae bacterium]
MEYFTLALRRRFLPPMTFKKSKVVEVEMLNHLKILKDPKPAVNVQRIGDGMITLAIRPYANATDYRDVYFDLQEKLEDTFDENSIAAPIQHG